MSMKLRIICQICGRTRIIDTDRPVKQDHLGWDNYCLGDFEIEIPGVYDIYEIWICDKCHAKVMGGIRYPNYQPEINYSEPPELIDHYGTERGESGETYEMPYYDWGELDELIKESLGIKNTEETKGSKKIAEEKRWLHKKQNV